MSSSTPRSARAAIDDWDVHVAREAARQAEIEAAFDRADAYERLGEFRLALAWLGQASELSGGLSPASRAQRARLGNDAHGGNR